MNTEERIRRLRRLNVARANAKRRLREATDAFLDEVEAARLDPEAGLSYRLIARRFGVHHTSLAEMVAALRERRSKQGTQRAAGF